MNAKLKKSDRKRSSHVICIDRGEYRIDLWVGRVYRVAKPYPNDPAHMIRIIDESGEDYLYPGDWFVPIEVPPRAKRALISAAPNA